MKSHESPPLFDLIIVGGGPAGLSCAIEAKKACLSALILEKGSVVDAVRRFPANLVWFSTPELLEIGDVPFVIPTVRPTRVDVIAYYQRVCQHYGLDIRPFDAVEGIAREGETLRVTTLSGKEYFGRNAVVATGYYDNPNWLDVPGESLSKVAHHYDEAYKYYGCDVAVVGGRNSAVEAALDLFRHGARVTLIHRGEKLSEGVKYWIFPDIENRIKAGQIRALFGSTVKEITSGSLLVKTPSGTDQVKNDFTFVLIGFHPDTGHLQKFGVEIHPDTLAPRFDEKTFETNIKGLFVAGSLVAGKFNNKVFVENGRLHGPVIISAIRSRVVG
ncbi:MAG TPA: YpdA family putative bacillithiol disulfide reductase [Bacteroidota bacterium]|nr:YpdA family putative bacillithiol disulfide reductase [Bacteroidota bacterium]